MLLSGAALLLVRRRTLVLTLGLRETLCARPGFKFPFTSRMEKVLLCWRSNEVAGFSAGSERERNGENGGEKEESKDRHLMENHWCQVFLAGALRVIRSNLYNICTYS